MSSESGVVDLHLNLELEMPDSVFEGVVSLCDKGYRGSVDRGRELTETLLTYLVYGMSATKASRALYLHRNTVLYRLSQIEEIIGIRLSSLGPQEAIQLEFVCLATLSRNKDVGFGMELRWQAS